jgi:fatty acid/phospholipid biosynthesis enzyme
LLKSSEAVAKLITDKIREIIKTAVRWRCSAARCSVKPALGKIKKLLDPANKAPLPCSA